MSAEFLLLLGFRPPTLFSLPDFRMPHTASQAFLRELEKKLWTSIDLVRLDLGVPICGQAVRQTPPQAARAESEEAFITHGGNIGDLMVLGQDKWARFAHLRGASRAGKVRFPTEAAEFRDSALFSVDTEC